MPLDLGSSDISYDQNRLCIFLTKFFLVFPYMSIYPITEDHFDHLTKDISVFSTIQLLSSALQLWRVLRGDTLRML
jgi:hypothetical protein